MSISLQQKEQIIKNFYLLFDHFIEKEEIRKKISVTFQNQKVKGLTRYLPQTEEFIISFWEREFTEELLVKVVSHEFTHLYLHLFYGWHTHQDEIFLAYADHFLTWLRQNKLN